MTLKMTENIPRRVCTDEKLKILRKLKIETDGYDRSMEKILKQKGYPLPVQLKNESWKFVYEKYTRICLNRADCLAEALIVIKELNKI